MNKINDIRRGDMYYVADSPFREKNIQYGNRPAIIVSNNKNNIHSPVVEVVYLTRSKKKNLLPTHVKIGSSPCESLALCEQITPINKERLGRKVGCLTKRELQDINEALKISIGL